jgi:hypothetical protein
VYGVLQFELQGVRTLLQNGTRVNSRQAQQAGIQQVKAQRSQRIPQRAKERERERETGSGQFFGGWNLQASAFFPGGHPFDLIQFCSLHSKEGSHLDNLVQADEIFRVGTESLNPWAKLTTTHPLRYFEAEPAFTVWFIIRTQFTNYHSALPSFESEPSGMPHSKSKFGDTPDTA